MLGYHRQLLADTTRTLAFRDALRRVVTPDDIVVDLGSGSGILAYFAAEAGARKVFAIDRGHMADVITLMTKHLGFGDRIEVLHEHSSKVELPERGSILVTETLGAFAFEERILSIVIDARARLLRENAILIPNRIVLEAVPVEIPQWYDTHIGWWSEPRYGFDFSPLHLFASNVILTADLDASTHLAVPAPVIDVDLTTVTDVNVSGRASFEAARDATLHGFAGWFEATLADGITLGNRVPSAVHWNHVVLPLDQPIAVTRGTAIELELQTQDGDPWRWRGRVGDREFDQTTWLSSPPCTKGRD